MQFNICWNRCSKWIWVKLWNSLQQQFNFIMRKKNLHLTKTRLMLQLAYWKCNSISSETTYCSKWIWINYKTPFNFCFNFIPRRRKKFPMHTQLKRAFLLHHLLKLHHHQMNINKFWNSLHMLVQFYSEKGKKLHVKKNKINHIPSNLDDILVRFRILGLMFEDLLSHVVTMKEIFLVTPSIKAVAPKNINNF